VIVDDESMDLIYLKAGVEGPLHFWWNDPDLVREAWQRSRSRKDLLEGLRFSPPTGRPDPKPKRPDPIW
jgi:hypothetical protein